MKKLMTMLMVMLLCTAAFAEVPAQTALPVKILEHEAAAVSLEDALTTAKKSIDKVPEQAMIRAELAEMSDGKTAWVVTIFDTATFVDAWCIMLDASTGAIISMEAAEDGFFTQSYAAWMKEKGIHELWSMEDKQLYDALYAVLPSYGLPMSSDMSAEKALSRAAFVLGLTSVDGYEVGYGYLVGGEGYNGVWEICLIQNGQVAYRVNLDAVDGEVYYMEPDEAGNG